MHRFVTAIAASFLGLTLAVSAQQAVAPPLDPNRWEATIQKFEAEDAARGLVKGGVVFIGSSSIARWENLAQSFPDLRVVNRQPLMRRRITGPTQRMGRWTELRTAVILALAYGSSRSSVFVSSPVRRLDGALRPVRRARS